MQLPGYFAVAYHSAGGSPPAKNVAVGVTRDSQPYRAPGQKLNTRKARETHALRGFSSWPTAHKQQIASHQQQSINLMNRSPSLFYLPAHTPGS